MAATLISSSTSSVDLSRLPAPSVVEQISYEQIYAENLASLLLALPDFDATVASDPAVKLLEVFSYREVTLRQQFNDRSRQVMTAYATDSNLDHLASLVGVSRLLITAADPLTGAAAVYENDDALRRRIVLAPESFSVAGPESAYVFHALSADGTIGDASATSPAPCEVVVTILSSVGSGAATAAQLAAVTDVVTSRPIRPLTDQVTVVSASIVPFSVTASLTLFTGPDETVVLAAAQAKLLAYIAGSRQLGFDITRSALFAALHVEGVANVDLQAPAADIVIGPTECAFCTGNNVFIGGYGG